MAHFEETVRYSGLFWILTERAMVFREWIQKQDKSLPRKEVSDGSLFELSKPINGPWETPKVTNDAREAKEAQSCGDSSRPQLPAGIGQFN